MDGSTSHAVTGVMAMSGMAVVVAMIVLTVMVLMRHNWLSGYNFSGV
jgi:hypothetical protein